MHDPDDIHNEFERLVLAIKVVSFVLMIHIEHKERWKNNKDKVESKPCQVKFFVCEEILCLLVDI